MNYNNIIASALKTKTTLDALYKGVLETNRRITQITNSSQLEDTAKSKHILPLGITANRNLNYIQNQLRETRLAVAMEFRRIRKAHPGVALSDHPELLRLKELSTSLQDFSKEVDTLHALVNINVPRNDPLKESLPKAPNTDPLKASLPNVPQTKPIINNTDFDKLVTSAKRSWSKSMDDLELYAKKHKVKASELKSLVVDALTDQRFQQVFNEKPRDMSDGKKSKPR